MAICSKNEHSLAKSQLQRMNLWDEFVFPKISFSPKGQIVKQILEEMHLRPENTIFIDDNNMNLREVEHYVPGIHTLDALDGKTDTILAEILEQIEEHSKLAPKTDPPPLLHKKQKVYNNIEGI